MVPPGVDVARGELRGAHAEDERALSLDLADFLLRAEARATVGRANGGDVVAADGRIAREGGEDHDDGAVRPDERLRAVDALVRLAAEGDGDAARPRLAAVL